MEHSFDIEIAKKYGIECAIVYKHILFWIIKNKAHNKNFREGSYWTYFSINSLQSIFPYFSVKQLRTILEKMKEQGIIKVGNYNSQKYDRTLWYAFVEEPEELKKIVPIGLKEEDSQKGKSICPNGQMEVPETANGFVETDKPIPYNKTNIFEEKTPKKFVKPTVEEIKEYAKKINANINAEKFFYHYEARGWMMGKNKMKSWKAAVRTWKINTNSNNAANEFLMLGQEE